MTEYINRRELPTAEELEVIDKITQIVVARGGRVFPTPDEASPSGYTIAVHQLSINDIKGAFGGMMQHEQGQGNWGVSPVRYGIDQHLSDSQVDVWTVPRQSEFGRTPKRVTWSGGLIHLAASTEPEDTYYN